MLGKRNALTTIDRTVYYNYVGRVTLMGGPISLRKERVDSHPAGDEKKQLDLKIISILLPV